MADTDTASPTGTAFHNDPASHAGSDAHRRIWAGCERFLSGHRPLMVRSWLTALADVATDTPPDLYGEGELVTGLEREVADLLGTQSAIFVIKGVIAQQAALRVWSDRVGSRHVALHPASHLDRDEAGGYERLHGLVPVRLGGVEPFTVADLATAGERIGVVTVELPLRAAGFRLTPWEELVAISRWCRERGVPLHVDGARLWESTPYYGRTLAEIAALADSVYVSFYKGLGGLAGCALAGPADFLAETRPWITRHGGNLFTAFPYLVAAREGLRRHLSHMADHHARARTLATALAAVPGVRVAPDPPHTNAFQLYLPGTPEALREAALAIAEAEKVWLFRTATASPVPQLSMFEIQVGEATGEFTDAEIVRLVTDLIDRSSGR